MNELKLTAGLETAWANKDVFQLVQEIEGELFKAKDNRRVLRFQSVGRPLFLKLHRGVGWREIIKNLAKLQKPVLGARDEWVAIQHLQSLGVATMTAIGFGQRGANPANQLSFLITEELVSCITLEKFCERWPANPPEFRVKQAVIRTLAEVTGQMHRSGMNHRDCYICHFLMTIENEQPVVKQGRVQLYVVDLHRAQIRAQVPFRWLVKDVGSLYFSALDIGLTRRDILRFMALYQEKPIRQTLTEDSAFWQQVEQRAVRLYKKAHRRKPRLHFQQRTND